MWNANEETQYAITGAASDRYLSFTNDTARGLELYYDGIVSSISARACTSLMGVGTIVTV